MTKTRDDFILLVEDEPSILKQYTAFLRQRYTNIITASSGKEGLELFKSKKAEGIDIPVIVTDVEMPDMDGVTMIHRILALSPSTQFIVVSMLHEKHHISLLTARGITSLPKPIHGMHLQLSVAAAFLRYDDLKWVDELKKLVEKAPWFKKLADMAHEDH